MEATEAAELIAEAKEAREHENFNSKVALLISFMAVLLAIASMGGGNAAEDMLGNNVHASDTWAFYQAKSIRQTTYKLSAETLEAELQMHGASLAPEIRQDIQQRIEQYKETVARYENEPDPQAPDDPLKGEGKKQLSARARRYEEERQRAILQDPNFDYAEALFQIAIVLSSVAILANRRWIVLFAISVAAVATLLMLNGFFLFFHLPF